MIPILTFDIETVPDVAGLRRLRAEWATFDDDTVAQLAFAARKESHGTEFLPHYLQRIVAISCTIRDDRGFRVRSLGEPGDEEGKLVADFYKLIDHYTPQLVSWNGGGFDLPVLHYRALVHGVSAPRYWEMGEEDRDFKWNNYIGRYHFRHCDLMDVLAMYSPRANAPLDDMARLCGFPGKLGMDGSQVWPAFQAGQIAQIRHYCETDVVNTFLVYCRFLLLRGTLTPETYEQEIAVVKAALEAMPESHWQEYLQAWQV